MQTQNVSGSMTVVQVGNSKWAFHRRTPLTFRFPGVMGFFDMEDEDDEPAYDS